MNLSHDQSLPSQSLPVNSNISRSGSPGSTLTWKESGKRWHIQVRKCSCGSSWCPQCWNKRGKIPFLKCLDTMDWEHVRHVELTVDRGYFRDGEEAFDTITRKRGIGNLLKDLARTDQVKIVDWASSLEWHKDGFPHWHILIEVEDKGRAGMIGHGVIRHRWPFGVVVWESPIKSESHWKHMKGYFDRNGYFGEGKGHQSRLPGWALVKNRRIKRYETKKGEKGIVRIDSNGHKKESEGFSMGEKRGERRSYSLILNECGSRSRIEVKTDSYNYSYIIDVRYQLIKERWDWEYKEGKGLVMILGEEEFNKFETELFKILSVRGEEVGPCQEHADKGSDEIQNPLS